MIRVWLPAHLRTLARVSAEVEVEVQGEVTVNSILDALEARYPMLGPISTGAEPLLIVGAIAGG